MSSADAVTTLPLVHRQTALNADECGAVTGGTPRPSMATRRAVRLPDAR